MATDKELCGKINAARDAEMGALDCGRTMEAMEWADMAQKLELEFSRLQKDAAYYENAAFEAEENNDYPLAQAHRRMVSKLEAEMNNGSLMKRIQGK